MVQAVSPSVSLLMLFTSTYLADFYIIEECPLTTLEKKNVRDVFGNLCTSLAKYYHISNMESRYELKRNAVTACR